MARSEPGDCWNDMGTYAAAGVAGQQVKGVCPVRIV